MLGLVLSTQGALDSLRPGVKTLKRVNSLLRLSASDSLVKIDIGI